MNALRLQELGISENEAKVLLEIIRNASITATELVQATGMNRKVVYDAIRRLAHAALITSSKHGKERVFVFGGQASIDALIEKERHDADQKATRMRALLLEIARLPKEEPADATVYSGTQGVRVALNKLLELRADYVSYGAPQESETVMTETFWLNFHRKQEELGIRVRLLFNDSLRAWATKVHNPRVTMRFLSEIQPLAQTIVCKDHVIIIIWTANPSATVLVNDALAQSYLQIFEMLWTKAA
jgi:sugar-specific transcriptional regulator TrmB